MVGLILVGLLMARAIAGQPEEGAAKNSCRLSLSSGQPSYRYDQPIDLQITLENQGEHPVRTGDPGVLSELVFEVSLPSGKPAPMTLEGRRQATMPTGEFRFLDIAPKASAVIRIESLSRLFDMTLVGTYTVAVSREVWVHGTDRPFKVRSNTIKIEVHEREKINTPATKAS